MNFSQALEQLKLGKKLARKVWEDGIFIILISAEEPYIDLKKKTKNGNISTVPVRREGEWHKGWGPYQEDILAEDWVVVD